MSDRRVQKPPATERSKPPHAGGASAPLAAHPLCGTCAAAGRATAATVCNHRRPEQKLDPATIFDGPFNSSCAPCHDGGEQKTERAGYSVTAGDDAGPLTSGTPANRSRREREAEHSHGVEIVWVGGLKPQFGPTVDVPSRKERR